MKEKLNIVLCYSSSDKFVAGELYTQLSKEGWVNLWDVRKILPGQDRNREIKKAAKDAQSVIVCISKTAMTEEGDSQRELKLALDIALEKPYGSIFIIPLKLEECDLPFELSELQHADYFKENREEVYQKLLASLRSRADSLGISTTTNSREPKKIANINKAQDFLEDKNKAHQSVQKKRRFSYLPYLALLGLAIVVIFAINRISGLSGTAGINVVSVKTSANGVTFGFSKNDCPITILVKDSNHDVVASIGIPATSSYTMDLDPGDYEYEIKFECDPISGSAGISGESYTGIFSITPGSGNTQTTPQDTIIMVDVPEGIFTMGSAFNQDELPIHEVNVPGFRIDQTEVTNAAYAKCVEAGKCAPPKDATHFNDPAYAAHPVVYVSWHDASSYCQFVGERLPTEAEWEKAARYTDQRTYPWGNNPPNSSRLNYMNKDTTPIGNYPGGRSHYEVLDMAGNVWEWVSSLYIPYPYNAEDGRENLNVAGNRVIRGGSWRSTEELIRSADRYEYNPDIFLDDLGFRCAQSP